MRIHEDPAPRSGDREFVPAPEVVGGKLFPLEPTLSAFRTFKFAEVRERISRATDGSITDVSTIWGTPRFTGISERQAFRPDKGDFRGTATDGNDRMPYVGFWLSNPGINSTFLVADGDVTVDPTLVKWFSDAGIGGHHVAVKDTTEMAAFLKAAGHHVYGCDNYGPLLDPYSVNSRTDFDLISNKAWTRALVGTYAAYEEKVHMFDTPITAELFDRVRGDSQVVFVKLCNDEHGGMGVKPVRSLSELSNLIQSHRAHTAAHGLSPDLILQQGISGTSKSFCFFLDARSSEIPVLAVTDQMVDSVTGRDLGNRHYPLTGDVVRPLTGMIQELRTNILAVAPKAFGFVMCDFIQTEGPNGAVFAIDPGLRPSASSPSAMAQMWVASATGKYPYVRNNLAFSCGAGFTWEKFMSRAGTLCDPATILTEGRGIVPFSWEPKYGTGRIITIGCDEDDHRTLLSEIDERFDGMIVR